ncbi:hypothetical protein [Catenuloplanes indicus]|uniref:Uncharacterized protein n=1 Tax=Catenuloplanes indicus TaxID=137267 RepID=A0AAE3W952_9ACTN|nr:hypothetical protein [Catenuloplanes indicus]MDQ0371585.1 hypothetical protein [Catenuloplanes indicus]
MNSDETCKQPAGWGTPNKEGRCKRHGGSTPTQQKRVDKVVAEQAAEQVRAEAGLLRSLADIPDSEISGIVPATEVLRLIAWWLSKVNLYTRLIREAYAAAERLKAAAAAEQITLIDEQIEVDEQGRRQREDAELQTARADLQRIFALGGQTALVGVKYDADRGQVYGVDEGVRALVQLEERAADRLSKNLHLAHQMKIDEKRIDLAKFAGAAVHQVIVGVLTELGVKTNDERVWQLVIRHMDLAMGGVQTGVAA